MGNNNISITCSEETLVEHGSIPSIPFFEKEASMMASNDSPNATLKDEKRKRIVILNIIQKKQDELFSHTIYQALQIALFSAPPKLLN